MLGMLWNAGVVNEWGFPSTLSDLVKGATGKRIRLDAPLPGLAIKKNTAIDTNGDGRSGVSIAGADGENNKAPNECARESTMGSKREAKQDQERE